jgi:hypothetical protein
MGWYHSKNIIEGLVPNARLTEVVEPWFLGNEASKEDKAAFQEFVDANPDVKFLKVFVLSFGVAFFIVIILIKINKLKTLLFVLEFLPSQCFFVFLSLYNPPQVRG